MKQDKCGKLAKLLSASSEVYKRACAERNRLSVLRNIGFEVQPKANCAWKYKASDVTTNGHCEASYFVVPFMLKGHASVPKLKIDDLHFVISCIGVEMAYEEDMILKRVITNSNVTRVDTTSLAIPVTLRMKDHVDIVHGTPKYIVAKDDHSALDIFRVPVFDTLDVVETACPQDGKEDLLASNECLLIAEEDAGAYYSGTPEFKVFELWDSFEVFFRYEMAYLAFSNKMAVYTKN